VARASAMDKVADKAAPLLCLTVQGRHEKKYCPHILAGACFHAWVVWAPTTGGAAHTCCPKYIDERDYRGDYSR